MTPIPPTGDPVTPDDLEYVLADVLPALDGHPRSAPEARVWLAAAEDGGWSRAQLASALRTVARTFTGFRVTPGHVEEQVRADAAAIRGWWKCPSPPRALRDDPAAEIRWRRQAFGHFRDRALVALVKGGSLADVPLLASPEQPPPPALAEARTAVRRFELAAGQAVPAAYPLNDQPEQREPVSAVARARARARAEGHRPSPRASRGRDEARTELSGVGEQAQERAS